MGTPRWIGAGKKPKRRECVGDCRAKTWGRRHGQSPCRMIEQAWHPTYVDENKQPEHSGEKAKAMLAFWDNRMVKVQDLHRKGGRVRCYAPASLTTPAALRGPRQIESAQYGQANAWRDAEETEEPCWGTAWVLSDYSVSGPAGRTQRRTVQRSVLRRNLRSEASHAQQIEQRLCSAH